MHVRDRQGCEEMPCTCQPIVQTLVLLTYCLLELIPMPAVSAAQTNPSRSSKSLPAVPRRCARGPCRYRSKVWATGAVSALSVAVELHEDQVPDLDVARLVLTKRLVDARSLRGLDAHVVEDFRTRPARAGVAHLPKIIFRPALVNSLSGHATPPATAHRPLHHGARHFRPRRW